MKRLKENVTFYLKTRIVEEGILSADDRIKLMIFSPVEIPTGLTVEQQKQLLILKFEHQTRLQPKQLELEHYQLALSKLEKCNLRVVFKRSICSLLQMT